VPSSLALSLSPAVASFFGHFFSVAQAPNRGLPLLLETLRSFSADHRHVRSAATVLSNSDILPVIKTIMQPSSLDPVPVRIAAELCVRWEIKSSMYPSRPFVVLHRSNEVAAAAAAAAAQASASGNQREFESCCDLLCLSFLIHSRHASAADIKLFESTLQDFVAVDIIPTVSQLAMSCLASCIVIDSCMPSSTSVASEADDLNVLDSQTGVSEFASSLSRDKRFELATDAIMALLRFCRRSADDSAQENVSSEIAALQLVRSVAAKLALKASRMNMVGQLAVLVSL
jgi:hypothetical protein